VQADATRAEFAAVRTDIDRRVAEIHAESAAFRGEFRLFEKRLLGRFGGMLVVAVGVILAAIRYLPP
jgi:hypothetical protein